MPRKATFLHSSFAYCSISTEQNLLKLYYQNIWLVLQGEVKRVLNVFCTPVFIPLFVFALPAVSDPNWPFCLFLSRSPCRHKGDTATAAGVFFPVINSFLSQLRLSVRMGAKNTEQWQLANLLMQAVMLALCPHPHIWDQLCLQTWADVMGLRSHCAC